MDTPYVCPDCREAHADPGEAVLGVHVRCLACRIELDLALELILIANARPAAA